MEEEEVREIQRGLRGIQQTVADLEMKEVTLEGTQVAFKNWEKSSPVS